MRTIFSRLVIVGLASVMAQQSALAAEPSSIPPKAVVKCETAVVVLDTGFPAGNIKACETSGKKRLNITIAPEDPGKINCSAWYAFRLTPQKKARVTITLNYERCGHRYWPKVSSDGKVWNYLPAKHVKISEDKNGNKQARIKIKLGKQPLFVSAQEIFLPRTYAAWIEHQAKSPDATAYLLGKSAEGRDISMLSIKAAGAVSKEQVVLIGRQHPPEVTGALAMLPFVEALLSDDPLAKRYRARFETIVVPMLNPDGVVRGHWRHNTGSTDLNRDWGPFAQPETKLMDALLKEIANDPDRKLRFFSDFHSTQKDVFYSIPDEHPTNPTLFTKKWLARLQERMPDYNVNRDQNHNATSTVSKAYVYETYGVPAVTFEIGDETDRKLIARIGRQSALAMMETLLATDGSE